MDDVEKNIGIAQLLFSCARVVIHVQECIDAYHVDMKSRETRRPNVWSQILDHTEAQNR